MVPVIVWVERLIPLQVKICVATGLSGGVGVGNLGASGLVPRSAKELMSRSKKTGNGESPPIIGEGLKRGLSNGLGGAEYGGAGDVPGGEVWARCWEQRGKGIDRGSGGWWQRGGMNGSDGRAR